MNVYKISKILVIAVCIIAIAFFFASVGMDVSETNNDYIVDYFIYLSYLAMLIAFVSVFYFVIKNLISNKKELKSALIAAGLFAAVVLVAFILADGTEVKLKESVISPMYSKVISTGLNTFYILAFISVAVLAWTGISKFKK
jgi:hypothetical protein